MANYPRTIYATLLAAYAVFVLTFGIFVFDHQHSYRSEAETDVVPVYWDAAEPERGQYDFSEAKQKLQAISERGEKATIALGYKLPDSDGSAECIFPQWYDHDLGQLTKDKYLFQMLRATINQFENNPAVVAWQIEDEPSIALAGCPEFDLGLLNAEIALVENVDDANKEIIVDRGTATLSDFRNWLKGFVN